MCFFKFAFEKQYQSWGQCLDSVSKMKTSAWFLLWWQWLSLLALGEGFAIVARLSWD